MMTLEIFECHSKLWMTLAISQPWTRPLDPSVLTNENVFLTASCLARLKTPDHNLSFVFSLKHYGTLDEVARRIAFKERIVRTQLGRQFKGKKNIKFLQKKKYDSWPPGNIQI